MEIDDHFNPVDFYANDSFNSGDQVDVAASYTPSNSDNVSNSTNFNAQVERSANVNLRRSVRPKPAAESLISSPPAIKF